jgi:hypothetical protein
MSKQDKNSAFKTHIPEPRWQQVLSVIIVVVGVCIWLWLATRQ